MSFFLSCYRVLKFTAQNVFRNFWLSFISLTMFVLTLLTVNVLLAANALGDAALSALERKVEVSVYFHPQTSEDIVHAAQGYLLGLSQVRDVRFVSAAETLQLFRDRHQDNPVILQSLEEVGENPFGDALIVSARSSEDFPFILKALETPEFSPVIKEKDFTDYAQIIDRLHTISERIRFAGIVLSLFFGLIATLVVFNTIRVAIYVHREEIGIMKLVGANDWFIRGPFLLEAMFYTVGATALMASLVYFGVQAADPWIAEYFGDAHVSVGDYFVRNAPLIFGGQFVGMGLLSISTTLFAMRRYLRV